jgi:hypothetical protein
LLGDIPDLWPPISPVAHITDIAVVGISLIGEYSEACA